MINKLFTTLFLLFPAIAQASGSLPSNYESLTGREKQALLWDRVVESEYKSELPNEWPGTLAVLNALNPSQLLGRPFQLTADEMPSARRKAVHTYGTVGQVEFVPAQQAAVSGILRGAIGLVRLSLGTNPEKGFVPGMALKFFVDHQPSINLHVMNSLSAQDSQQFFEKPFRNVVKIPVLGEFTLSIEKFLETMSNGNSELTPLSDEILTFQPTAEAASQYQAREEFRFSMADMKPVTLYKVYVSQKTSAPLRYVGELNLVSNLIPSQYGDEMLFFKHEK